MANVTFSGTVSAQANVQTVTITVTLPDASTDTLMATTLLDGSFSVAKEYLIAGEYSAKAAVPADVSYQGATSPSASFTISLATRSITLNVVVG